MECIHIPPSALIALPPVVPVQILHTVNPILLGICLQETVSRVKNVQLGLTLMMKKWNARLVPQDVQAVWMLLIVQNAILKFTYLIISDAIQCVLTGSIWKKELVTTVITLVKLALPQVQHASLAIALKYMTIIIVWIYAQMENITRLVFVCLVVQFAELVLLSQFVTHVLLEDI